MNIRETLTKSPEFHGPSEKPFVRMNETALKFRDDFNARVDAGTLAFEEVPCLCGNTEFSLISEYDRFGIKQKTVMCTNCGLVQSNPRMTAQATEWFYSSDFYGTLYGRIDGKATKEFILAEAKNRPTARFEFVKQHIDYSKIKSVLEIGCAGGWSLYPYFTDGKKVVGYDYGPALVEAGKKLGMDLRVGRIEDDKNCTEKFDLIMLCHVVEHLLDPVKTMRDLQKYLAPGGHIFIEVPDMRVIKIGELVNAHCYYFTEATFLHYMGKAGLHAIAHDTDKKSLHSQVGLFSQAKKDEKIHPLTGEYERMKTLITNTDASQTLRRNLKYTIAKLGLLAIASFIAHLGRKLEKRRQATNRFL